MRTRPSPLALALVLFVGTVLVAGLTAPARAEDRTVTLVVSGMT